MCGGPSRWTVLTAKGKGRLREKGGLDIAARER